MKPRFFVSLCLALAVYAFGVRPALADIYTFKDERGVVHFTNIPGLDPRYRLLRKEGSGAVPGSHSIARAYMPSAAEIARYSSIIETAARTYGVDKALVHAVISAESGYNPQAVSRTGAQGLMQLMPETARRYGVRNSMDPVDNIYGGVKYLHDLLTMFNGNLRLVVAAYNAGENAVIRYGLHVPPYPETLGYVPKVLEFYRKFQMLRG
ncbi:MAG TPA: lytic transglycosylase domain-containing protein [Usitatibacter sp.]|nr:lytic transglycosylase domain-containing protein [Usitatibacter sp.]